MARSLGDNSLAMEYRRVFELGSRWTDANLFNGEFYIQEIKGFRPDQIAPVLRASANMASTEDPEYQMGKGSLIDQLLG